MTRLDTGQAKSLRLFNEKADALTRSRFAEALFNQETGVMITGDAQGRAESIVVGPDDEAVAAFVLTFRLFRQNGDGISIRELAEIYESESVPTDLRDEFDRIRTALNDRLDSPPMVAYEVNGESITRGRILEVFLYGGLAHANPEKLETYEQWQQVPMFFALLSNEFHATLGEFFNCVRLIRSINERLLADAGGDA